MQNIKWYKHKLTKSYHNNFDYSLNKSSSRTLCVMTSGDDPIKQFTSLTEVHNEIHSIIVFKCIFQAHNVRMIRHFFHNLYLSSNIVYIHSSHQLLLRNQLASKAVSIYLVSTKIGNSNCSPSKLATQIIYMINFMPCWIIQDGELASTISMVVTTIIWKEKEKKKIVLQHLPQPSKQKGIKNEVRKSY